MWVKKNVGRKKIGKKKRLAKKNLGQKKIWVKKVLGQIIVLHESSSWVKIGLHAENQFPGWSKSFRWVVGGGFQLILKLSKPNSTITKYKLV